jgi:hypothetical protein
MSGFPGFPDFRPQFAPERSGALLSMLGARKFTTAGAFSATATEDCIALIFAWGGGSGSTGESSGGAGDGTNAYGSGALYRRIEIQKGQTISGVVGSGSNSVGYGNSPAPGGDTTVSIPTGEALVARGSTTGAPGTATGGDINRRGGSPGQLGEGSTGATSSGGGGAGFGDLGELLNGGRGGIFGSGGGGLDGGSSQGGNGQVIIFFVVAR